MHYNEHSDFYYQHIHGDKETFHMAFRRLDVEYSMPIHSIFPLDGTMCQHDFEGERLFQHRNFAKWSLFGDNRRVGGFQFEEECLAFLKDLRKKWKGAEHEIPRFDLDRATFKEKEKAEMLCENTWLYRRIGYDERPMSFSLDGLVELGGAGCEIFWCIRTTDASDLELLISSEKSTTCRLVYQDERWEGSWLIAERMPVELLQCN